MYIAHDRLHSACNTQASRSQRSIRGMPARILAERMAGYLQAAVHVRAMTVRGVERRDDHTCGDQLDTSDISQLHEED